MQTLSFRDFVYMRNIPRGIAYFMSGISPATKRTVEFPQLVPSQPIPSQPQQATVVNGPSTATAPSHDDTTVAAAAAAAMTALNGEFSADGEPAAVVGVSNGDVINNCLANGSAATVFDQTSPLIQRQTRSLNLPSHVSVNCAPDGYGPPSLGHRLQQRLINGHANSRSTGAEPERLARQDAIQWSRKEEPMRKSPLGRTDDALLNYDDGSDGEFESELFSGASATAAAAMVAEAAAAANAQRNHNSRLLMGAAPRQYSLAVHVAGKGAPGALGTARMTRGVTCEEFEFPVAPPSPQSPAGSVSPQPPRVAPTVSAPPYINKLPSTPEEKSAGKSSTASPLAARRALGTSGMSYNSSQLPHPIDAYIRQQPTVAVTLNGCLRKGAHGGSFNPLPSCVSLSANGRLDADYGSLYADHKSRSLTNLENAAVSRRVCISPANPNGDPTSVVNAGQQWRHASSRASNLRQLNRQNLRSPGSSYTLGQVGQSGSGEETVIRVTSTVVPQHCMSQPSTSCAAASSGALRELTASPSSMVMTNANATGSATTTVRSPRCESPIRIFPRQHHIVAERDGDVRLQQSLSTPCPSAGGEGARSAAGHSALANGGVSAGSTAGGSSRKDSEYRRFRSEGSTTNSALVGGGPVGGHGDMDGVAIDDLSPIADRASPPHRLNLFQDAAGGGNSGGTLAKHSQTEQVLMMHTLKTKLQKYQSFIDEAFKLIHVGTDEQIFEGCTIVTRVMTKAWLYPKISHDLAYALCDYLRDQCYTRDQKETYLEILLNLFIKPSTSDSVRLCCGRVLEECMSSNNREYVVSKNYLRRVVQTAEKLNKNPEQQRISLSIMESLFKHSAETTSKLVEGGVLDHILLTCKRASETPVTLRHAALALANLSLYSTSEAKKKIIQKKLPDWLFLLASQQDEVTRYYACLAICMLASSSSNSKEMEGAVTKSGTLALVEPFLVSHQPTQFARDDYKHSQGRPKEWLIRLLPMLRSKCREAKSMAAFHFTMEASTKKDQQKLEVLQEIGAIQALKEVASSPDEVAAKFASEALTIIGEEVPYKLSQQVPCWSISDVKYWVEKIGFGSFGDMFTNNMVDGDMLLLLTEKELEEDLRISSGLLRKRFMRELESLKIAADYSSVDESQLDQFLMSLSPELSVYTYQMLFIGLNRNLLPQLTNEMMKTVCGIQNPIHRLKLRQALQDSKHIDDIEVAILSKQIDVFISYRRSTGNQLASLIKVLLQLRGYKVFIDVDKLYAGKFDSHLLKNIQAAKHFILVLTPHSLDRLLNDYNCEDWIHKELRCAFEHQKNVIPIFDQQFEFPSVESELPDDIRQITKFNGVRWVHDYQEACVDKVERFIKGELNRMPSLGPNQLSVRPSNQPTSRKAATYKLANASPPSSSTTTTVGANGSGRPTGTLPSVGSGGSLASSASGGGAAGGGVNGTGSALSSTLTLTTAATARNRLAVAGGFDSNSRALSMEKQRRKFFSSSVSTVYSDK